MKNNVVPTRRRFLGHVGAATIAAGSISLESLLHTSAKAATKGAPPAEANTSANRRRKDAEKIRMEMAHHNKQNTPPNLEHPTCPDEELYPHKIGSYSKGLPHHSNGEVDLNAYHAFTTALTTGYKNPAAFDTIPLGGQVRLTSPQAGLAFEIEGADAHSFVLPPPPAFASREEAAEIAENYWMALLRDVPFRQYASNPMAAAAAADLNAFGADFKGAKIGAGNNGAVTPALLFRGLTPGDKLGPWGSQYWYQPCSFGANQIDQKIVTALSIADGGADYMTSFDSGPGNWLDIQRGLGTPYSDRLDLSARRYIRTGRDIAQWVHIDVLFQGYFQAMLVLLGLNAPVDDGNPYINNPTQMGFATFGAPHIATLMCEVATRALHAVWFHKWFVHRRLRPEVFAARVDRAAHHNARYPVHPDILESVTTSSRLGGYLTSGNALLPMAFPEGSPTHPSYGAGHATVAGACVTILKAWFKESTRIVDLTTPREPTEDGLDLTEYTGPDAEQLTVGGELNKIASNVALGRNIAGVHWRSDGTESLKLGEAVAIHLLKEHRHTYNENFGGFSLTKFDGTTITV